MLFRSAVGQPDHQLPDAQLVGPDPVDRRDRPAEHVVLAAELPGALDGDDVLRLLDDADEAGVASRVAADRARRLLGHVAADLAEPHLVADLEQDLGEPAHARGRRIGRASCRERVFITV